MCPFLFEMVPVAFDKIFKVFPFDWNGQPKFCIELAIRIQHGMEIFKKLLKGPIETTHQGIYCSKHKCKAML